MSGFQDQLRQILSSNAESSLWDALYNTPPYDDPPSNRDHDAWFEVMQTAVDRGLSEQRAQEIYDEFLEKVQNGEAFGEDEDDG